MLLNYVTFVQATHHEASFLVDSHLTFHMSPDRFGKSYMAEV